MLYHYVSRMSRLDAFSKHDHAACASAALGVAAARAERAGARLTPVRRRVLELLLEEHRALGAYELLERLVAEGHPRQPPLIYRALEFLETIGLVHRIERLNAYVACALPGEALARHRPAFLICESCRAVAELPAAALARQIGREARKLGFEVAHANLEALGRCPSCAHEGEQGDG